MGIRKIRATTSARVIALPPFAIAAMLAGTASAQTPTLPAVGPEPSEKVTLPAVGPEPSEKVICVRSLADTGSHLGASKVCHTESEWAMIHNQSVRTMQRYETIQNKTTRAPPEGAN